MQNKRFTKSIASILCVVLLAVAVLMTAGCNANNPSDSSAPSSAPSVSATVVGEGATVFTFTVIKPDGTVSAYEVHTDETTVGAALVACELIAGDESEYGLYVKTVAGVTLDYDTDKMYWAFYEGDAMAMNGVDSTAIVAGATYSFRAAK